MRLARLRLGPRLGLGFGLVLALAAGMAVMGVVRLSMTLQAFKAVEKMQEHADQAARWQSMTQLNVTRALAQVRSGGSPQLQAFFGPRMKETSAEIGKLQAQIEGTVDSDTGRALLRDIGERRNHYVEMRKRLLEQLAADPAAVQAAFDSELLPAAQGYEEALSSFQKHQQARADEEVLATHAAVRHAQWLIGVLGMACLGLGVASALLITLSVTRPLRYASQAAHRIAAGDLAQPVRAEGSDEVAALVASLSTMQDGLRKLVGDVHRASDSIRTASSEVASGSMDLSSRTEQAAANLQQTAASMDQISSTVRHTADSSAGAKQLSAETRDAAQQGGDMVARVMATMGDIAQRSKKIGEITGVIDGIAFQTNILALNAAVEAARAGEHGRGFAVVAGEVRSLATRAADAAREIKSLIGATAQTVDGGTALVNEAGGAMRLLVDCARRVDQIMGEISAAAAEQSTGVHQVSQAVMNLDQMTQQNAALVEESAAAAANLEDQAAVLAQLMSAFRLEARPTPALA